MVIHLLGLFGTILVLAAYLLLSSGRVASATYRYQLMNLVGALSLVGYSIVLAAWAVLALNTVWAVIAVAALLRISRDQEEPAAADGA